MRRRRSATDDGFFTAPNWCSGLSADRHCTFQLPICYCRPAVARMIIDKRRRELWDNGTIGLSQNADWQMFVADFDLPYTNFPKNSLNVDVLAISARSIIIAFCCSASKRNNFCIVVIELISRWDFLHHSGLKSEFLITHEQNYIVSLTGHLCSILLRFSLVRRRKTESVNFCTGYVGRLCAFSSDSRWRKNSFYVVGLSSIKSLIGLQDWYAACDG